MLCSERLRAPYFGEYKIGVARLRTPFALCLFVQRELPWPLLSSVALHVIETTFHC
jgi:hypothetical protein